MEKSITEHNFGNWWSAIW